MELLLVSYVVIHQIGLRIGFSPQGGFPTRVIYVYVSGVSRCNCGSKSFTVIAPLAGTKRIAV